MFPAPTPDPELTEEEIAAADALFEILLAERDQADPRLRSEPPFCPPEARAFAPRPPTAV